MPIHRASEFQWEVSEGEMFSLSATSILSKCGCSSATHNCAVTRSPSSHIVRRTETRRRLRKNVSAAKRAFSMCVIDCKAQLWLKEACGKMCWQCPSPPHPAPHPALEFKSMKLPLRIQKCCPRRRHVTFIVQ